MMLITENGFTTLTRKDEGGTFLIDREALI